MVYNTGVTTTAYSHTGLSLGDYRRYRVAGLDIDGNEGRKSGIASATIGVLTAPLNLAATPGNQEVTLTWLPPVVDWADSIQKYQVRHAETGGNYGAWSDVIVEARRVRPTWSDGSPAVPGERGQTTQTPPAGGMNWRGIASAKGPGRVEAGSRVTANSVRNKRTRTHQALRYALSNVTYNSR